MALSMRYAKFHSGQNRLGYDTITYLNRLQLNRQLHFASSTKLRKLAVELLLVDESDESSLVDLCRELKAHQFPNLFTLSIIDRKSSWQHKAFIKKRSLIDGGGIDVQVDWP
jgi:hypothetical protein